MENVNLGDVLLLPAPRISYPPMDIVLGIDFILSNFVEKKVYNELRCDPQYKSAVKNAQARLWKPYILSLAHFWCKHQCGEYHIDPMQSKYFNPNLLE